MSRRRLLPVAAALLASLLLTSQAAAECAWVMWVKHTFVNWTPGRPVDTEGWKAELAVPGHAACIAALRGRAERAAEPESRGSNVERIEKRELYGDGLLVMTTLKKPEHASISVEFRCFPDTVRPSASRAPSITEG